MSIYQSASTDKRLSIIRKLQNYHTKLYINDLYCLLAALMYSLDWQGIITCNYHNFVGLFVYLFGVARAIFQLCGDFHHCRDRAANLDLCSVLTAFSIEGSFRCHIYCDTGPPFLRSYPKDSLFYLLNAVLLAKEQSLPIFTRPARAEFELTTYCLLCESTTTRLLQPVTLA
jgi:hypothetical protein